MDGTIRNVMKWNDTASLEGKLCVSEFDEQLVRVEGQGLRVLSGILNSSLPPCSRQDDGFEDLLVY